MKRTILVTGGCGFIGHHFVEHVIRTTEWKVMVLDKLSYASKGLDRFRSSNLLTNPRLHIITWDLSIPLSQGIRNELGQVNVIVHMAADTHVDQSIANPVEVIHNNVMSTVHLLEYARELSSLECFFYFSTDEVFGSAPGEKAYKEWDRHNPTNPYSASKSAAENICLAYENTYNLPLMIVNVMNAFGERQHVEKFIPKVIRSVLRHEKVYIHADETCTQPGSRFYIHARNIATAVFFLLQYGENGEKYNICGEREMSNLELAQFIADEIGEPLDYELVNFHSSRPGHDLRYCLNGEKLIQLGWTLPVSFEESLRRTIQWTLAHPEWLLD